MSTEARYDFAIRGIHKVVDGDTVDAVIDVGFRTLLTQRLRLAVIDTPERGDPGYDEATAFLKDWLDARTGTLRVRSYKEESFARWLSDVYGLDGETASEALLREGHAVVWKRKR